MTGPGLGAVMDTVEHLREAADKATRVASATLRQGLAWRSVGNQYLSDITDQVALRYDTDARDLRATAADLRDGAW